MEKNEMVLENLKRVLSEIESVQGLRKPEVIFEEVLENNILVNEVTVLRNNRFELSFNKEDDGVINFSTTYSNQEINEDYMKEMNLINMKKELIENALQETAKLIEG